MSEHGGWIKGLDHEASRLEAELERLRQECGVVLGELESRLDQAVRVPRAIGRSAKRIQRIAREGASEKPAVIGGAILAALSAGALLAAVRRPSRRTSSFGGARGAIDLRDDVRDLYERARVGANHSLAEPLSRVRSTFDEVPRNVAHLFDERAGRKLVRSFEAPLRGLRALARWFGVAVAARRLVGRYREPPTWVWTLPQRALLPLVERRALRA